MQSPPEGFWWRSKLKTTFPEEKPIQETPFTSQVQQGVFFTLAFYTFFFLPGRTSSAGSLPGAAVLLSALPLTRASPSHPQPNPPTFCSNPAQTALSNFSSSSLLITKPFFLAPCEKNRVFHWIWERQQCEKEAGLWAEAECSDSFYYTQPRT